MKQAIEWELITVKASEIKPNLNNPKIRDDKGFKRLQKSMAKFGKVFDGICNKDLSIIDGNSRAELNSDEIVKVFVPSRQLAEDEFNEMAAIFDLAKAGSPDMGMIEEAFSDEFFEEWDIEHLSLPSGDELIGEEKNKPPVMKITFKTPEQLQSAENDITELIDRKYKGAFYSVSAGEI